MVISLTASDVLVTMPLHEFRVSVTGGCNHDCFYCGPFSDGKHSDSKDFRKLSLDQMNELAQLLPQYRRHIQITGGEPTLRKDLEEIFSILKSQGNTDVGLTTNCSRLTGPRLQELINRGLRDLHVHVPTLNPEVFRTTIRRDLDDTINNIYEVTRYAKDAGIRIEFNTPVTRENLPSLEGLFDFCFTNQVNLKPIEVVTKEEGRISIDQIRGALETWMSKRGITAKQRPKDDRWYGNIYEFGDNFFFRIAPTTPLLLDNLAGAKTKAVLDGRYWIGGVNGEYLFNSAYFPVPQTGSIEDLRADIGRTIKLYDGGEHDKE